MMSHKQPIRTYQRKTAKRPFVRSLALPAISSEKYNSVENSHFDKNGTCDDTLNYDPFETTFDRIAKGAVVPPMPLDINQNDSWNSNNSDSDIIDISVKSPEHIASNLLIHNDISNSTYVSHKLTHKRKKPKKYEPNVMISKGILSKRIRITSMKDVTKSEKVQGQKKRGNKIQKNKKLDKFKSNRICNEQSSHINSNSMDNLKSALYENGISYSDNHECLRQNVLKINKMITSRNDSIKTNSSIADFEHMANYQQIIKPCFVKLNTSTVQNYISNRKKTVGNKQNILHNVKFLYTDTLQTHKNISRIENIISESISTEYDFENFKHISAKQCSVALCDNIVKDWYVSKNKENMKDSINISNKSNISHLVFHNPSEIASNYNKSIELASCNTRRNKNLIKNSSVKVEKLKIGESVKGNRIVSNEKEQNIVSSTPIGKHIKPSTCLVILSPINCNIYDKLHSSQECSLAITKEDVSNIDQKDSRSLIMMSEYYKLDTQEQQTQVLLLSQKSRMSIESSNIKNNVTFCKEDTHVAHTKKYETECDVEMGIPHSLNMSIVNTDKSQSLFDNTTYSDNHSADDIVEDDVEKKYVMDALICKSVKTADSSVNLYLEQKQLLSDNEQADANSQYISPSNARVTFRDLDNTTHMGQEYESEFQENYDTEMNTIKAICENLKDETVNISKHSLLGKSQDNSNIIDARVLLTRLQDPIRIGRRMQYPKWHLSTSNISNSLNNEATQSTNEVFHYAPINKVSNVQSVSYDSKYSKNMMNSSLDHFESFNGTTQLCNGTNKQTEKFIFLRPGKYWARSLSILNNINDRSNLDKLSIGKGKKWRRSVKDILDMQKQGIFQSCLKKDKDDTSLSSGGLNASNVSFNSNRCEEFNLANNARFSKRISVRVVLNNTSIKCDIKDAPFLEAFGITAEESPNLKLSHCKESLIHDDRIINIHSTIARDVVLQRCSQNYYMPFSNCFPDSYLERCRKIGEGVYGEVFLHEYDGKKSVIKIIPIEGEQLVNGEPQKKFSEILSEIVIAKELDNLRLNATYKTSGFIEVKNISCIIGKYPEKLIELWNIYDNDKTSDNDCPSMFGENQLYIALELGHGGEDLEAFVFQTAEEAYALFLQTALALAVAEKALEFEHRDLHWGNVLISRTKEQYVYYNLGGREIKFPSHGVKVSIIDFTLSRMLYQGYCMYNDLALDPVLFTAHGEYQFEIYRLMRDKIQNNWQKYEPFTNVLWLHYTLDKMMTMVRYKKKSLKIHKHAITKFKKFKDTILNYDSAFDFVINSNSVAYS